MPLFNDGTLRCHRARLPLRTTCILLVPMLLMVFGCENKTPFENKPGVDVPGLQGATYNIAIMDEHDSLTLLGRLRFEAISEDIITGSIELEAWGEQSDFPGLAVNRGEQFPDGDPDRPFSGLIFGESIILTIPLPESDRTIGIFIDEQEDRRLFGTVDTLPDKDFSGRIDALRDMSAP